MRLKEFMFKMLPFFRSIRLIPMKSAMVISTLASVSVLCLLIFQFGFQVSSEAQQQIFTANRIFLQIFLYTGLIRILFDLRGFRHEKGVWIEVFIILALVAVIIIDSLIRGKDFPISEKTNQVISYILLVFISTIQLSKQVVMTLQRHLKPEMMFTYSFLFIIITGAFLLMLPNAHSGQLRFVDALFTSASAVCVTGLTVVDTSSAFTLTGQIILLVLIQIGGVGVMTFTSFIAMSFFSQTSFQDQMALKSILNEESMNNIFRTLFYILFTTILVEAGGAYLLWLEVADIPQTIIPDKIFFSVFHSISGFCNAGFSTLPENLCNPAVRHLYGFQCWLAVLIILGGIGFPIVFNYGKLLNHKIRNLAYQISGSPRRIPSHVRVVSTTTRIVIPATIFLLIVGTTLFLIFENSNTLSGLSPGAKLATSFFSAVTPRTAGFNNVPMGELLPPTVFLTLILMWIGASPMSTGGGIKTTTFVIALKNMYAILRGKQRVEIAKRQLTYENVNRAGAVIFLSLLWIGLATTFILVTNPQGSVTQALFEVTSALSTVGLTLNFTPTLNDIGKVIISITMFVGRVGLIVILSGIFHQQTVNSYTYADDNVIL